MSLTKEVGSGSGNTLFLSIKAGNLVQSAEEGQEKAVARSWKDKDGNEGVSYEILHKDLTGFITGISTKQGKYGEDLEIFLEKDGSKAKLTIKVDSRYFADFAKKVPNLDLTKEVTMNAFDFKPEGRDKNITGVSLKQGGESIKNAYWDGKKNVKGYPVMEEDAPDSDDWKLHFLKERKYLKKKLALIEIPKVDTGAAPIAKEQAAPQPEAAEDDDLPF